MLGRRDVKGASVSEDLLWSHIRSILTKEDPI